MTDARWVPAENLHATLAFLGEMPDPAAVCEAVAAGVRGLPRAHLRLEGLGAFPSTRRARVIWAGLSGDVGTLSDAAARVAKALRPLGHHPEPRPFAAHVTLARLRVPGPVSFDGVAVGPVEFGVAGIEVYRSHLGRPAPRYEQLCVAPFDG